MSVAIVVMMLVVMVVIAMSVLVGMLDTIEVFVYVEVGKVRFLGLVLIAIDFHDRPFAAFRAACQANPAFAHNPSINPALGGSGINDFHFHPSQARTVRLTYSTGF
jgi:hypothetical protein